MAVYQAKNFDHLLGIPGFSDQLLKNHFTLYQGYVTNSNLFNFLNQNIQKIVILNNRLQK